MFSLSYVMFESKPEKVYKFVSSFDTLKYSVLIVTFDRTKAIKEKFNYVSVEVVQLTSSGMAGTMDIQGLGFLMVRISRFIEESSQPVVVFDMFRDIIEANGMNMSLLMLRQLMAETTGLCMFVVSVDTAPLTNKNSGILFHNMTIYDRN